MPLARKDDLIIKALTDEVVVYDLERHEVHCLNRAAALVWQHCDGRTTTAEIIALLRHELKIEADHEVVWLALDGLRKANLLRSTAGRKARPTRRLSRRALIQKLGVAAAASLPLITSMLAPQAAAAATLDCSAFTTQITCEDPLKACGDPQFFCRWRDVAGTNTCICTNA
jgi:hypothetical protein